MTKILLAGLGGFVGAALRFSIGQLALRISAVPAFLVATVLVNVVGCFVIGTLGGLAEVRGPFSAEVRAFVIAGVLGGFTTYSTFGFETMQLLRDGDRALAYLNLGLHLVLGLTAVAVGHHLGRVWAQPA